MSESNLNQVLMSLGLSLGENVPRLTVRALLGAREDSLLGLTPKQ
jgi:hypothetical protein